MTLPAARDPSTAPLYELRAKRDPRHGIALEIWQGRSPNSPQRSEPRYVAGLKGRNLSLIEHRVMKKLKAANISLGGLQLQERQVFQLDEDLALQLGLLFRVLAPMRSRENMRMVADGIEAMGREEASYWLGMAMHRKNPRRVLTALRYLLIDPKQKG